MIKEQIRNRMGKVGHFVNLVKGIFLNIGKGEKIYIYMTYFHPSLLNGSGIWMWTNHNLNRLQVPEMVFMNI